MLLENFSSKDRKTIGVFVSRLGRVWGPEFVQGITDSAAENDLNVICFVGGKPTPIITPGHLQPSYGLYDIARTERLAGVIVSGDLGYELGLREMQLFIENYLHLPLIVNALQVDGAPNIIADNMTGMHAVLRHLFDDHKYKRVAFICGPENQIEAEQRFLAYRQALRSHNIPYDDTLVAPGDFSIESGRAAVRILLDERNQHLDAIVCANDRMALGAFEALQLRGYQVPGNIALTGFDDIREARSMGVPLTTVRQSFYEMGKQSVDLLLRRMNGEALPDNIITPTQLITRWSCGCLPESVKQVAGKGDLDVAGQINGKRDLVIHDLLLAAGIAEDVSDVSNLRQVGGHAWDILLDCVQDGKYTEDFLHNIEHLVDVLSAFTEDTAVWQNVVSVLRQHVLARISERKLILHIENVFQQARVLIGELSLRNQTLHRQKLDLQEEVLQAFSTSMAPTMSLQEIGAAVERHFPDMGIDRMFVMIYSSMATPQSTLVPPSDNYHLLMQYEDGHFQMPEDHPKWATGHLIPRGKTPEFRRYAAIVMPLILAQNRFGFIWMEMTGLEWEVYTRVRNLISSALLRTMLVEQRAVMQSQVEQLLYESQLRAKQLAIATQTAERTAEEIARLYNSEKERRKDAEMLSRVARNLSSLLRMDEMPQQILKELSNLLSYGRGALLMEDSSGLIQIAAYMGFPEYLQMDVMLVQIDSGGGYSKVVESGEAIIMDDVTHSSNWQPVNGLTVNYAWMGVPLLSKNKVIGVLSLSRAVAGSFNQDDLLLVTTFAMQAAISLENARLYDEVTRFNELMERLVAQRVEELNIAYSKLEKLDKNKSEFIQVTAHELRTPLTVMKGYLGMLRSSPAIQQNDSLIQAVEGAMKGTERLHLIFNSMLDVVRLEGQTLTPHFETVIVALLLQLVHKEYKQELTERNIHLIFEEGTNSLPFIQADSQLLQKVLDAIIVNAIKFTPDGGVISIGGRVIIDEQIGDCLEIHVRDTGIGIDPVNHQIIFEKLIQLGKVELHSSGRTKFKGGGPGLGLAIASGIVKAHNGKIWVESPGYDEEKCPGSTFFIRLPISQGG